VRSSWSRVLSDGCSRVRKVRHPVRIDAAAVRRGLSVGFELPTIYASGWAVVATSTALALAAWIVSFVVLGQGP
jgi:hypothetical protein